MFCSVQSMGLSGIESYPVTVEVDCRRGLPRFDIVGLPDTAVKESRERVHSAIGNLGYTFPAGVLVVNLAPADTKKSGPLYGGQRLCGGDLTGWAAASRQRRAFDGLGGGAAGLFPYIHPL